MGQVEMYEQRFQVGVWQEKGGKVGAASAVRSYRF